MKTIPQRTCIVCRQKGDKSNFVRIVKTPSGEIAIDKTGKLNGRGAYVCDNIECIKKAQKTHALNRAFKCEISDEVYQKLVEDYGKN